MSTPNTKSKNRAKYRAKYRALFRIALLSCAILIFPVFTPSLSYAGPPGDHHGSEVMTHTSETSAEEPSNGAGAAKGCAAGAAVGTAVAPGIGTIIGCVAAGIWGWLW